jgi:hypothetical protein
VNLSQENSQRLVTIDTIMKATSLILSLMQIDHMNPCQIFVVDANAKKVSNKNYLISHPFQRFFLKSGMIKYVSNI